MVVQPDSAGPVPEPSKQIQQIVLLVAGLGAVCVAAAFFLLDKRWSGSEVAYDVGFGLLVATAVSLVADRMVQGIERRDADLRELETQRAAHAAQAQADLEAQLRQRLEALQQDFADICAGIDEANRSVRDVLHESQMEDLRIEISSLQADVHVLLVHIAPGYVDPNAETAERVVGQISDELATRDEQEGLPPSG